MYYSNRPSHTREDLVYRFEDLEDEFFRTRDKFDRARRNKKMNKARKLKSKLVTMQRELKRLQSILEDGRRGPLRGHGGRRGGGYDSQIPRGYGGRRGGGYYSQIPRGDHRDPFRDHRGPYYDDPMMGRDGFYGEDRFYQGPTKRRPIGHAFTSVTHFDDKPRDPMERIYKEYGSRPGHSHSYQEPREFYPDNRPHRPEPDPDVHYDELPPEAYIPPGKLAKMREQQATRPDESSPITQNPKPKRGVNVYSAPQNKQMERRPVKFSKKDTGPGPEQEVIRKLREDMNDLKSDMARLRTDNSRLRSMLLEMTANINGLVNELKEQRGEIEGIRGLPGQNIARQKLVEDMMASHREIKERISTLENKPDVIIEDKDEQIEGIPSREDLSDMIDDMDELYTKQSKEIASQGERISKLEEMSEKTNQKLDAILEALGSEKKDEDPDDAGDSGDESPTNKPATPVRKQPTSGKSRKEVARRNKRKRR
jgi:hypothetical protein